MKSSPFRLLLRLFRDRFLENDTVSPGGGFQNNIYQVIGIVATAGMFVGYYVMPQFMVRSLRPATPQTDWVLQNLRVFFPAYSFGVAGLVAMFHWDMLLPDRRDFLILAPFPIRLREMIAANRDLAERVGKLEANQRNIGSILASSTCLWARLRT